MMKTIYSFLLSGMFLLLSQVTSAKDIYLSAAGNDSNDGLSATTPVKTLMRVNDIVEMEDVIHVDGLIKITEEADFATKIEDGTQNPPNPENGIYLYHRGYYFRNALKLGGITFVGTDPANDGFSGEEQAALFQFDSANPVTFKNLKFTKAKTHRAANGQYGSDASVAWCQNTELMFDNCVFTQNDITRDEVNPASPKDGWGNRGALSVNSGKVTFKKCEFTYNSAQEGGALFLGAGDILIEDCYFGYNESADVDNSKGGVICTWVHGADGPLNVTISKSIFEGNSAKTGGVIGMLDKVSYVPTNTSLTIDRCIFVGNQAVQERGGAILLDNFMGRQSKDVLTISNSMFYANSANSDGGAICIWSVQPNSVLTLINCTLYGNFTNGNPGHGGGIGFMTGYETYLPQNMTKNIYNCIIDGNYATEGGSAVIYSDLTSLYSIAEHPDLFNVKNSYIGTTINMTGRAGIDAEINRIDYYTQDAYNDAAGLDDPDYYGPNNFAIPLLEDAETRTYGNTQYLVGTKDLLGKTRVVVGETCAIGACEVTSTELDNEVIFENETSIRPLPVNGNEKLEIKDGVLYCSENGAFIQLYNLSGQLILQGLNKLSLSNIDSGLYIAKVRIGTDISTQKFIIR